MSVGRSAQCLAVLETEELRGRAKGPWRRAGATSVPSLLPQGRSFGASACSDGCLRQEHNVLGLAACLSLLLYKCGVLGFCRFSRIIIYFVPPERFRWETAKLRTT
jgi:hypothetical protein